MLRLKTKIRTFSTVIRTLHEKESYAVLTMNRLPVNSLNIELINDLHEAIKITEDNKKMRGFILRSTNPKVFSAGLDISQMYKKTDEELAEFWTVFQQLYMTLYMTRLATVASIEGHCPAGGCFLALCCDYRIMKGPTTIKDNQIFTPKIGLNETQLGIVAPPWFADVLIKTIGHRESEKMLALGRQVDPMEAKKLNLVDEVIMDKNSQDTTNVMDRSKEVLEKWLKIPDNARVLTKTLLRSDAVKKLISNQKEDVDNFIKVVQSPLSQVALEQYIQSLKQKK